MKSIAYRPLVPASLWCQALLAGYTAAISFLNKIIVVADIPASSAWHQRLAGTKGHPDLLSTYVSSPDPAPALIPFLLEQELEQKQGQG